MGLAQTEVYEVATFYHHFDVVKENRDGTRAGAGGVDGARVRRAELRDGGRHGNCSSACPIFLGREVRVIAAPCVGRCEQAPVAVVHQKPVAARHARERRGSGRGGRDRATSTDGLHRLSRPIARRAATRCCAIASSTGAMSRRVIKTMEDSGLRGLGGAGFPTGRKWRIVRGEPAPRLMAVNIDEGEPGTFKDRVLSGARSAPLSRGHADRGLGGGYSAIYIYLRDEYHGCRAHARGRARQAQANPPMPLPEIELRRGAGAYICGEESAMIESIEGKRGMPRLRPPYVAQVGLFGRPTLEHNFETLYWVRELLREGRRVVCRRRAATAARGCAAFRSPAASRSRA